MLRCGSCDARILTCAVCGDHDGEPPLSATCQRCFEARAEDAMVPREHWHLVQHGDYRVRLEVVDELPERPIRTINHLRRADVGEHLDRLLKGGRP